MFVTLLRDIKNVGKKSERIRVSDAYARNVLIPKGLAIVAEQSAYRIATTPEIDEKQIEGQLLKPFEFKVKVNEKDRLYKKILPKDIEQAVAERLHIDQSHISADMDASISALGEFSAKIHMFQKSFTSTIKVEKA